MRLNTSRFGEMVVADEKVITFTRPIIGFPEHRRFTILPGPQPRMTHWLQSTEDGGLAFILMDPRSAVDGYTVELGAHELDELGTSSSKDLDVYSLVVVPADAREVRTNLKAPIVVNPKTRLAKQTILDKSDYPIRYYLRRQDGTAQRSEEAIDARSNA